MKKRKFKRTVPHPVETCDCYEDMCKACLPSVYYQIYECLPLEGGGDFHKPIIIREHKEDAELLVNVLTNTDINWGVYGYERITVDRTLPIRESKAKIIIDRIIKFFKG
jgi:hypothetical protein